MLQLSPEQIAVREVTNIINMVNNAFKTYNDAVSNGTPVRGTTPAITAEEYKSAFGTDAVTKLSAAYDALNK